MCPVFANNATRHPRLLGPEPSSSSSSSSAYQPFQAQHRRDAGLDISRILAPELFLVIFAFLPGEDLGRISTVCTLFHNMAQNRTLWCRAFMLETCPDETTQLRNYRYLMDNANPDQVDWRIMFIAEKQWQQGKLVLRQTRREMAHAPLLCFQVEHDRLIYGTQDGNVVAVTRDSFKRVAAVKKLHSQVKTLQIANNGTTLIVGGAAASTTGKFLTLYSMSTVSREPTTPTTPTTPKSNDSRRSNGFVNNSSSNSSNNRSHEDEDLEFTIRFKLKRHLDGPTDDVNCSWLQPGMLATGSSDSNVRLYDLETGTCVSTFTGSSRISHVQFDLNSSLLVSASIDRIVRFFDIRQPSNTNNQTAMTTLRHRNTIMCLRFSEAMLVTGTTQNQLDCWDYRGSRLLCSHPCYYGVGRSRALCTPLALHLDDTRLVYSVDQDEVTVLDNLNAAQFRTVCNLSHRPSRVGSLTNMLTCEPLTNLIVTDYSILGTGGTLVANGEFAFNTIAEWKVSHFVKR